MTQPTRRTAAARQGAYFQKTAGEESWTTPRYVTRALGSFDLDPCACATQPWSHARRSIKPPRDGLSSPWRGRVWLNPPYGNKWPAWVARLADHGGGVALISARPETVGMQDHVFARADAVLFLDKRVVFHYPDGSTYGAVAPSLLVAYGRRNAEALHDSGLGGALVRRFKILPRTVDGRS